jgi:hypothetical protein
MVYKEHIQPFRNVYSASKSKKSNKVPFYTSLIPSRRLALRNRLQGEQSDLARSRISMLPLPLRFSPCPVHRKEGRQVLYNHSTRRYVLSVHCAGPPAMLVPELRMSCLGHPILSHRHLHSWVHKESRQEAGQGTAARILASLHRHSHPHHKTTEDNSGDLGKVPEAAKGMPVVHRDFWISLSVHQTKGPRVVCSMQG